MAEAGAKDFQTSAGAGRAPVEFEALLTDFSAALVRASVGEIDLEIERWLEQIVLAMDVDRSTVIQVDPADGLVYFTHQAARLGVRTPAKGRKVNNTAWYPWVTAKILSGELIVL
jgi:hypothetical protein